MWPPVLLAALVFAIYLPGLRGGFVFDDYPNIVDNANVHVGSWDPAAWLAAVFSSNAGLGHRPLAMASFALNYVFTGLDPAPMKLTNIGIHALNVCLVWGLLQALLELALPAITRRRREWVAGFAATAWAIHPINLMGVLFVVQRMESLCHLFVFAGLWLYLKGRQRQLAGATGGWWRINAGVLGGMALGLMSKESAVLLPLYAACIELCLPRAQNSARLQRRQLLAFFSLVLVLPAVVGVAWLLPHALAPGAFSSRDFTLAERLLTESRVVLDYLGWSLLPSLRTLGLYHDDIVISRGLWQPPATVAALAGLSCLVTAAVLLRGKRPLIALGIAWFLSAQLLTATIMPLELVFEHRNYFGSLGVVLAMADALLLLPMDVMRQRIGALIATLWLLLLGMTTVLRANEWGDPVRFAASEAAKHPQSPRAAYEYARVLVIITGYRPDSPAVPEAFAAIERDRALPHSGVLPHSAYLLLAARTHRPIPEFWWHDLQARLRAHPIGPQEISAITAITRCVRDRQCDFPQDEMLGVYQAALSRGENPDVLNVYADYVLNVQRQPSLALALWGHVVNLRPEEPQYRINRIKLLIAMEQYQTARHEIAELRQMSRLGNTESAARDLERLLDRESAASDDLQQ